MMQKHMERILTFRRRSLRSSKSVAAVGQQICHFRTDAVAPVSDVHEAAPRHPGTDWAPLSR